MPERVRIDLDKKLIALRGLSEFLPRQSQSHISILKVTLFPIVTLFRTYSREVRVPTRL